MITRRVVINLVAFVTVSLALVAYGVFDLLGNPFAAITTVSTILPSASGLATNFSVTYEGIQVGTVSSISLVHDGARVTMAIKPGADVPADVAARVVIGNALGQQEIELVPRRATTPHVTPIAATGGAGTTGGAVHGAGHRSGSRSRTEVAEAISVGQSTLQSGAVLPVAPNSEPASVGTLVAEATSLLQAIPAGDLNRLLHQVAVAVGGQADNLRTIDQAGALFAQEFLAYQDQFRSLLANAPPVLDTVTANASSLQQGLQETAAVLATLAAQRENLVGLLHQGSAAGSDLESLLAANRPDLGCLVHDLSATTANLAEPTNLAHLQTFLQNNGTFFGIVGQVAPSGPAKALRSGEPPQANQVQLRVRLLLPPRSPAAVSYSTPHGLTTIKPGAGCVTEFGAGAGPATQAGFTPADGGTVDPPTAAEAEVRGGGPLDPLPGATAPTVYRTDERQSLSWFPVVVAAAGCGLAVVINRRRTRRTGRCRRSTAVVCHEADLVPVEPSAVDRRGGSDAVTGVR